MTQKRLDELRAGSIECRDCTGLGRYVARDGYGGSEWVQCQRCNMTGRVYPTATVEDMLTEIERRQSSQAEAERAAFNGGVEAAAERCSQYLRQNPQSVSLVLAGVRLGILALRKPDPPKGRSDK